MRVTLQNQLQDPRKSSGLGEIINTLAGCERHKSDIAGALGILFKRYDIAREFMYGFGGNHVWVKETATVDYQQKPVGGNLIMETF